MITSEQAIIDTVRKHCLNGVFNVAVGEPSNFSNIIVRANIPFLTVEQNGEFWLVHETVVPQPKPTPGTGLILRTAQHLLLQQVQEKSRATIQPKAVPNIGQLRLKAACLLKTGRSCSRVSFKRSKTTNCLSK